MGGEGTKEEPCFETITCQENEVITPCANFECFETCSGHLNYENKTCPTGEFTCDYQSYLDEYCSKMSPEGEGDFFCRRAKVILKQNILKHIFSTFIYHRSQNLYYILLFILYSVSNKQLYSGTRSIHVPAVKICSEGEIPAIFLLTNILPFAFSKMITKSE